MQDPNPMPWGALDRYQAHFIVHIPGYAEKTTHMQELFVHTQTVTRGHFAAKKVDSVGWNGIEHPVLNALKKDAELNGMIARQSVKDATIYIEQTDDYFRIHGRWSDGASFGITQELFEIYDRIAGHIKSLCLPPV